MSPVSIDSILAPLSLSSPSKLKAWSPIPISSIVAAIRNPIRETMAGFDFSASNNEGDKPLLNLGLGDPSVFGNMPPPGEALDEIETSLRSGKSDGYPESIGYAMAREAVANYFDEGEGGVWRVGKEDVVMTHGASGALEMAFSTLADASHNVVLPRPLFTAYETMIGSSQATIRYYDLLPEKNWEVDLASLESQLDENTAFFVICNPSNPTGSNWSEAHLRDIAALSARKRIIVLADEVYAGMAWNVTGPQPTLAPSVQGKFNKGVFTPYASVATESPALIMGAISKRWLAPGWRLGWVIVHDPVKVLEEVRDGLGRWAFRIQGPNSTMQRALPGILANTPEKFFDDTLVTLKDAGEKLFARLQTIEGLEPLLPQGAMYLVCGGLTHENFPSFANEKEFTVALKKEENVLILPGVCFRLDGYMRFVTTVPLPILMAACDRIEAFCARHRGVKA